MEKTISAEKCRNSIKALEDAMYVIGGKWTLRVIIALKDGHTRFNDLQRTIDGISAKVLSGVLKDLEQNGFVRRKVDTGIPVVVEYELLSYADTLQDVLSALVLWGEMHREKVIKGEEELV
ncbi:DNA-binding HxlR family transcriptional regulator [Runella defluvii]|uniref:DNA-binding HxlR family transcriptional regulator n=1 Tax=Runella defluvii TaxID=370973 RepID=A0A7W5ZS34_9BACT|nr:helix-turn-helix domain-containing protein [Runella defluvii]MBB3841735.1 DNA-binding HxlR family transcriptional regulator [Runella defluvii]